MNLFFWRGNKPVVPTARLERVSEYEHWKDLEPGIEYLVLVTPTYIVWVDKDLDVDWSLRDDVKDDEDVGVKNGFEAVLNRVATLETSPCDEMPRRMKLHFKRLLGEGIARGLEKDFQGAQSILNAAAEYIAARSQETSRYWYLWGSTVTASIFLAFGAVAWVFRIWLQSQLGAVAFWEVLCACAGATGALLSVIGRTGNQHFDCSAGKRLHYLEAASRIGAGAISGLLVGLAVHSQVLLTALTHGGNLASIMILGAMASGVSERLATSIIADLGAVHKEHPAKKENTK